MNLETKVYQKSNRFNIFTLGKQSIKDIISSHFLAQQLAKRDIKAQYRQSFLGILWALIIPLITAMVWVVLNSSGTVKMTDTGVPYPVYAFSGTLIWSIITESINSPIASTNGARGIISKINFPKEALIISGLYKLLFNSTVKIGLLVVFVFIYGVGFHWSLLTFPLVVFGAMLVGTTIGLFLTPIGILYSDVSKLITITLQFLMYATPVVYAIPEGGFMKTLMEWNPLTPIVITTRDVVLGTSPTFLTYFLIVVAVSIPIFILGMLLYRVSIPVIVERLSA